MEMGAKGPQEEGAAQARQSSEFDYRNGCWMDDPRRGGKAV